MDNWEAIGKLENNLSNTSHIPTWVQLAARNLTVPDVATRTTLTWYLRGKHYECKIVGVNGLSACNRI